MTNTYTFEGLLFVEDLEYERLIMNAVLKQIPNISEFYPLHEAVDGAAALETIYRHQDDGKIFRLILTDIHMPNMDGYDLLKKIRTDEELKNLYSFTPIVTATSQTPEELKKIPDISFESHFLKQGSIADRAPLLKKCFDELREYMEQQKQVGMGGFHPKST